MKILLDIFLSLFLIAGILLMIVIIFAIISTFFERKKYFPTEKGEELVVPTKEFKEWLQGKNVMEEILKQQEIEAKKPKKRGRKPKNKKED